MKLYFFFHFLNGRGGAYSTLLGKVVRELIGEGVLKGVIISTI